MPHLTPNLRSSVLVALAPRSSRMDGRVPAGAYFHTRDGLDQANADRDCPSITNRDPDACNNGNHYLPGAPPHSHPA